MADLLPCPFCGSETAPRIVSNGIGDFYVRCVEDEDTGEGCGARTSDARCEGRGFAAKRWNKRATKAIALENVALRTEIERLKAEYRVDAFKWSERIGNLTTVIDDMKSERDELRRKIKDLRNEMTIGLSSGAARERSLPDRDRLAAENAVLLRVVEAARRCVRDDADDDLWAEADAELRNALRALDQAGEEHHAQ